MSKFSSYFQYNWIKYLLIIFIPLIFWLIVYSDIDQVKYDESVRILYIGEDLDEEKLQEDLNSNIAFITTQKLVYISVMTYSAEKKLTYDYLRNKVYSVDIVIVSNDYYDEEILSQIFMPFTNKLKEEFMVSDFINFGENSFGLKLSNNSLFHKFYSKNEEVSLFLSPHSLNIGKAYGYGKIENTSAISIVKYLLGGNLI